MNEIEEKIDKKIEGKIRIIDKKLENSFKAIKEDMNSIKSSLKEKKEIPEKENGKISKKLDEDMEKSIKELKGYFEESVYGLKEEIRRTLEEAKSYKPELDILKKDIKDIKKYKKKYSSGKDILRLRKIINSWKEKYKQRKIYEKYIRDLKEKDITELKKRHREFEGGIIKREKDIEKLYSGMLSKEQGNLAYQRKKDLEYIEEIKREEYKEKGRIERDFKRKLEEQRERELEIIKRREELAKLEKNPKLRKIQTALIGERKFFFTLLFIGLLSLSIFSLFKRPFDFPGLAGKVFWSLIILVLIICLYYIGFFDFLKNVNSLNKEYMRNREYENRKEHMSNREEKQIKFNNAKSNKENGEREVNMHRIDRDNMKNNQSKTPKRSIFSRMIDNLSDK